MKKIIAVLALSTLAAPAFAGGLAEPVEPVVAPVETGGSLGPGAIAGLVAAAAVLAIVASDDDDDNNTATTTQSGS